jgi:uncharacterized protein YecA (UPF0149 family)
MDTRDGRIITLEQAEIMNALAGCLVAIPMTVKPTARQMQRSPPKVGRNEPCPCGSGKKFKKCHLSN